MWPFRHRAGAKSQSNVATATPQQPALTATTQKAADFSQTISLASKTIAQIDLVNVDFVKDLISDTGAFEKRLESLASDLALAASLDKFSGLTKEAYHRLRNTLGESAELVVRPLKIGTSVQVPAVLAFLDGPTDPTIINQNIVKVAQQYQYATRLTKNIQNAYKTVMESVIADGIATTQTSWSAILQSITKGHALLFVEGCPTVLDFDAAKLPARNISTPSVERSILGPQDAFNEVLKTQMTMIRMHLKTPSLRFDTLTIGSLSQTTVAVGHIVGLTNPEILAAVKRRLAAMRADTMLMADQLVPLLSSSRLSLFPQVRRTERPTAVARELALGKVVIMTEHTPFVLSVPNTLMDFYQTLGDYAQSFWATTLERTVRLVGLALGLLLPPLYIALVSVNPELLPTKLATTIAGSRVGLPFPPVFEVLAMWTIIEILREASLRLPKELSSTLGTVGAIVVGTAVVKAGVVSPLMIVVITLTALGLFTSPSYEMATPWRILFFLITFLSWLFGLLGIILGLLVILAHLSALENFGVSYISPFGPYRLQDLKDTIVKFPEWSMTKRPSYLKSLEPSKSIKLEDPMPHPHLQQAQKWWEKHDV